MPGGRDVPAIGATRGPAASTAGSTGATRTGARSARSTRRSSRQARSPPPTPASRARARPATGPRPGTSRGAVGRALLFFLVQAPLALLLTAGYAAAGCVAALADRSGRSARGIAGAWGRALLLLFRVGVRAEGLEHVLAGPALYAANHASALDILIVFGHLPADFRIVYKKSLSLVPLLGWAIRLGGHVPIDRSHPFRARRSLERAARRIRGGLSLVVFPEGTRSPDGEVRRFKRGSFALALTAGVPVVPVSLVGVKAVVPRGLPSLRPGTVRVALHPPVPVAGRPTDDAEALAEEVRRTVAEGCRRGESARAERPDTRRVENA
jgi:1-acyl-sn-glycerol-3-phosphate acyltransferase